ncbi:hypothetical protein VNO77_33440 [Canavalia gladiata]|uniref:Uncharacterized protein n=1 Tax=Canavalia gladiata TaxID=3824 RepID=A0AAN9KCE5_CANGL
MYTSTVIRFRCLAESRIYYIAGEIFSCNSKSHQSKLSLQFKMNFGVRSVLALESTPWAFLQSTCLRQFQC